MDPLLRLAGIRKHFRLFRSQPRLATAYGEALADAYSPVCLPE